MTFRRLIGIAALAGLILSSGAWSAQAAPAQAAPCATTSKLTLLNFNDFHGRLANASPNTVQFVGTIEEQRAAAGEDKSLVLSAGDSVGGSLFASFAQNDEPTLALLNAMDVEASAVGNHEFDQGWPDLRDRIKPGVDFPYLGANVYAKSTTDRVLSAFKIFDKSGLKVAVVGAVTGDLPSLVSPAGIADLSIGNPVEAVNKAITELKDGNADNGEADVIVVEYHEGAPAGEPATLASQVTASPAFAEIVNQTDARAQVIFNAHTHMQYAWEGAITGGKRPVVQSGSYASNVGKVVLTVDAGTGATCAAATAENLALTKTPVADLVSKYPRVAQSQTIVNDAIKQAETIGQKVIGNATASITRAKTTGNERGLESTLSNKVAQMFADKLGKGDPNFIGLQNPGGTRADIDEGPISYAEAASVLPFANSLMTTQLTGAQFKTVLEQQWQVKQDGTPLGGARPYLQLGLSRNVSYTYDATKPWGSRITSIMINGQPIDPKGTYTIGSGSFLIAGGDNFWELAKGRNTTDSGRVDLEAWIEWLGEQSPVSPSFAKQAVSVHSLPTIITDDPTVRFAVGVPQDQVALDTLDFTSLGAIKNTDLVATIENYVGKNRNKTVPNGTEVGRAKVVNGRVEAITVKPPKGTPPGTATLVLTANTSGTVIGIPVTIKDANTKPPKTKPTKTPKPKR